MTKNAAFLSAVRSGNHDEALALCLEFLKTSPGNANALADAAVCLLKLKRFEEAITYAKRAVVIDPDNLGALDTISHAAGALKRPQDIGRYGLMALQARDRRYGGVAPSKRPLRPRGENATRNIISFSLFGESPKYCEPAVLNALEQPRLYPGWHCRFHVDETVPDFVRKRLREAGAEVVDVNPEAKRWPPQMWRFAAADDPQADRIIFRDADSVISAREAEAVREWTASGRQFHIMRDGPSHTELILAGLWGMVAGALPRMSDLVADFLTRPVESQHFADQHFLREFVWSFARRDMLQHDSLFGFLEHVHFPDGPRRDDFHVGACESWPVMRAAVDAPDGTRVQWRLVRAGRSPEEVICTYPATVKNGYIEAHVPLRYAVKLRSGELITLVDRQAD